MILMGTKRHKERIAQTNRQKLRLRKALQDRIVLRRINRENKPCCINPWGNSTYRGFPVVDRPSLVYRVLGNQVESVQKFQNLATNCTKFHAQECTGQPPAIVQSRRSPKSSPPQKWAAGHHRSQPRRMHLLRIFLENSLYQTRQKNLRRAERRSPKPFHPLNSVKLPEQEPGTLQQASTPLRYVKTCVHKQ